MASQYSSIAKDFSSTRFKVWPVVKDFIDKINPDSINIELGCGNGKNMLYCKEKNIPIVGVDNCKEFVDICNERDLDVKLDNIQNITSYESSTYDNILCIAVFII
jgi:cyclopropane fatty-acyl-phospholipid synthase-like methyltransferase